VFTVNHVTKEITNTDPSALAGNFPVSFAKRP